MPQFWDMYNYCGGNVVNVFDPNGEDSYMTNRELAVFSGGETSVSNLNPLSHTFVFTTNIENGVEVVENTYSWGNTYNKKTGEGVWTKNALNDRKAAQMALLKKQAAKIGDESFDKNVDKAYTQLSGTKSHGWWIFNNCKHEAKRLESKARILSNEGKGNFQKLLQAIAKWFD